MKKLIISVGMMLCRRVSCFAENKAVNTTEQDSFFLWLIAIAVVAFVAMGIAIFLWMSFREKVVEVVTDSERIKNYFNSFIRNIDDKIYRINNSNVRTSSGDARMYEDKIQQLERRFCELKNEVNRLKDSSITTPKPIYNNTQSQTAASGYGAKFFRSKQGKFLTEEVSGKSEAKFEVSNIRGNDALFEYCGTVVNADFFTDVCSFENNPQDVPNKTRIVTTMPGKVKKEGNNWEVVNQAKIKFE
jgi:hypothetical protein